MTKLPKDQSFDGIADKFEKNIYGTSKGRLRHDILCYALDSRLQSTSPLHVLDLGAGTGAMAETLASWGHKVDLVDVSADALEVAKSKPSLLSNPDARFLCSSLQSFESKSRYDVVVCHAVLEWLADPLAELGTIVKSVAVNGLLSLSFFNQDAKLFSNICYGNFDYVQKGMQVKNQVRLNPQTPLTFKAVSCALTELGFSIEQITGVRCFHDYLKNPIEDESDYQSLLALEKQYCQVSPYWELGRYIHLICRQTDSTNT